jgi:hypothetical protein
MVDAFLASARNVRIRIIHADMAFMPLVIQSTLASIKRSDSCRNNGKGGAAIADKVE